MMNRYNYRTVALCGYRSVGRKIIKKLERQGVKISYIIERNYEALSRLETDLEIPIVGFDEEKNFYEQAEVILLTGDLQENIIQECLQLAGIVVPIVKVELEKDDV